MNNEHPLTTSLTDLIGWLHPIISVPSRVIMNMILINDTTYHMTEADMQWIRLDHAPNITQHLEDVTVQLTKIHWTESRCVYRRLTLPGQIVILHVYLDDYIMRYWLYHEILIIRWNIEYMIGYWLYHEILITS